MGWDRGLQGSGGGTGVSRVGQWPEPGLSPQAVSAQCQHRGVWGQGTALRVTGTGAGTILVALQVSLDRNLPVPKAQGRAGIPEPEQEQLRICWEVPGAGCAPGPAGTPRAWGSQKLFPNALLGAGEWLITLGVTPQAVPTLPPRAGMRRQERLGEFQVMLYCLMRQRAARARFPKLPRRIFPCPGSVLVRPAAIRAVADAMGVVGQLGQHDGELLEAHLLVLVQVRLLEELVQVIGLAPLLKLGMGRAHVPAPAPPPWVGTELLGSFPALGRVWELRDVLTLSYLAFSPRLNPRGDRIWSQTPVAAHGRRKSRGDPKLGVIRNPLLPHAHGGAAPHRPGVS